MVSGDRLRAVRLVNAYMKRLYEYRLAFTNIEQASELKQLFEKIKTGV